MLTMIDGENTQATKMIMQSRAGRRWEMDMQAMQSSMPGDGRPSGGGAAIGGHQQRGQDMGSETVTVPAGTFTCEHYRAPRATMFGFRQSFAMGIGQDEWT